MMKLEYIHADDVASLIPYPAADANKYTRGKAMIVGGDEEYPGSAVLAVGGAERSGAGYVEACCSHDAKRALNAVWPSAVIKSIDDIDSYLDRACSSKPGHPSALLIGSGLAVRSEREQALLSFIGKTCIPFVLDGGALTMIATDRGRDAMRARSNECDVLLTPHYGEALRLASALELDVHESDVGSDADMARLALDLSRGYRAAVALKGPKTYIADAAIEENGACAMDGGTAALAKAGSGDVLAGMCVSYLAQGLVAYDAARVATYIHARAASCATKNRGIVSVCPEDVVDHISTAMLAYER